MKFLLFVFLAVGCHSIPSDLRYAPDLISPTPVEQNTPGFPVFIQNQICRDTHSELGLCALRVPQGLPLDFKVIERPYGYRLDVVCRGVLKHSQSYTGILNEELRFSISTNRIQLGTFICRGDIFPKDGRNSISSWFQVTGVVTSKPFPKMSPVRLKDKKDNQYLFFGNPTLYTTVFGQYTRHFKKRPIFHLQSADSWAIGETNTMVFKVWNKKD